MSDDVLLSSFTNFLNSSTVSKSSLGIGVSLILFADPDFGSLAAEFAGEFPKALSVPPNPTLVGLLWLTVRAVDPVPPNPKQAVFAIVDETPPSANDGAAVAVGGSPPNDKAPGVLVAAPRPKAEALVAAGRPKAEALVADG